MRFSIALDCADAERLARFWAAALHYEPVGTLDQYRVLAPPDDRVAPVFILQQVDEPRSGKNRMHLDLHHGPIAPEIARLKTLGATTDDHVTELAGTHWVVMHDPEGNEFCVVYEPGD
ncbi:MAG: VOC family protein [Actinomycetota bacterium]|nr:VOC family protein [Actinomycetota bacterium]